MSKLLVALTTIALLALMATHFQSSQVENKARKVMFNNWMTRNGKLYATETEKEFRFAKYLENAAFVEEHNAKFEAGLETYDLELNLFADMDNK
jgi:hypothetical protein